MGYFAGNLIPNDSIHIFIVTQTGYYSAVVTDSEGCNGTSGVDYIEISGVNHLLSGESNISIFPNPSQGLFQVDFPGVSAAISIISPTGQVIQSRQINKPEPCSFSITAAGEYIVQVKTSTHFYQQKVIISR